MKTFLPLVASACLGTVHVPVVADDEAEHPVSFSIESQTLSGALSKWAAQSGFGIGWKDRRITWKIAQRIHAPEVKGEFIPQAALERLLDGTSLTYMPVSPQVVAIRETVSEPSVRTGERSALGTDAELPAVSRRLANLGAPRALDEPEQIIVTGTHIPDAASPFWTYERSQIDAGGFGTIQAFSQRLPQNFPGGASENTVLSAIGNDRGNNVVQGSTFDLHSLGVDATLVLVNGRRIAPGNISGNFTDISLIPLSALDRIEIVPNSASAIYGSDAMAGVVNIILRRTFDGPETRLSHGFVAHGASTETTIAQTLGKQWASGSILLNYDYYRRTALDGAHRPYAREVSRPSTLLPENTRGSFYISAERTISSNVRLFADGQYAHRSSYMDLSGCICSQRRSTQIDAYTGTVGATIGLPHEWQLEATLSDSVSDTSQQTYRDAGLVTDNRAISSILSAEARLNGSLWSMPGGVVRHAVGVQVREEAFDIVDEIGATAFNPHRRLTAGYAELWVPLLGPAGVEQPQSRLELNVSGRSERYSDFGSTFNSQMGVVWRPTATLSVRGSYGTAFNAPLLNDLNPRPRFPAAVSVADPVSGGVTPTLFVFGGNSSLEPERATTWTAVLEWRAADDSSLSAAYYDIKVRDRIVDPSAFLDMRDALEFEGALGPTVVQRAPAQDTVQAIAAIPGFENFSGDPADIAVLVDSRMHNLDRVDTRGIDVQASFGADLGFAALEAGFEATYIIDFESRLASAAAGLHPLNTPYNAIDLKGRAHLRLSRGELSFDTVLNYVDGYTDSRSGIATPVSSWTTADVTLGYKTQPGSRLLSDISFTVGITNVTDEDPPFVRNLGIIPVHFDSNNADPLGRFYRVQFSKRW
jgi:iron complex outermembrane recepter protein